MATYTVQDTTMTALGDAIRNHKPLKDSKTNISTIGILKTENANGIDDYTPLNLSDGEKYHCSTMASVKAYDDVAKMKIKLAYITGTDSYNIAYRMRVFDKYYPMETAFTYSNQNYLYEFEIAETETIIKEFEIEGNELTLVLCPITFSASMISRNIYFYAEVEFLDINGNHLDYYEPIQVTNTMTPAEMVENINNLMTIPDEALTITGDCQYRFAYNGSNWLIETAGDKITTKDISNANSMFGNCSTLENIPFEINLTSNATISNIFQHCYKMKTFPKINIDLTSHLDYEYVFYGCIRMREVPEWFVELLEKDYNLSKTNSVFSPWGHLFQECSSLRTIPDRVMKSIRNDNMSGKYYGVAYSSPFELCYCLNELVNIYCDNYAYTSNEFSGFFRELSRVNNITFATNEDNTPVVRNWKSQTIDLTQYVGYVNYDYSITANNSGITADKKVTDDATYQALKDDPDYYTQNINYSRYNHDSAVNTINSLPDCSSSGGTNTIKFKGQSGALTDGGAINTLTEEEIAVASAKGWSVALV